MSSKRSRVYPEYKTKYGVTNWPEYDRPLVQRGDVTCWLSPEPLSSWSAMPTRRRGGQQKYSDLAIESTLTLRLVFHLPLREAEGFLGSRLEIMGIHLDVPDHTTLSRRGRQLEVRLGPFSSTGPIRLVVESSGLRAVVVWLGRIRSRLKSDLEAVGLRALAVIPLPTAAVLPLIIGPVHKHQKVEGSGVADLAMSVQPSPATPVPARDLLPTRRASRATGRFARPHR